MFETLLEVLLIVAILMTGVRRIKLLISGFAIQSLCIALICFYLGYTTGESSLYIVGIMTVLMKLVLTTVMMNKVSKGLNENKETDLIISIQWSYILCIAGIIITYGLLREFGQPFLKVGIVLMIVGSILLIGRQKAITQMIGFLTIENGIVLLEMYMVKMSLIIEAALMLEVLILALIMGIMIFNINKAFDTINTDKFSNIKG
ncbi:MAG TPA: hydrogenase [Clostridiales bacterium]|nr:MAG: hydrogenase [Clostridiales bacterium GWD2_32_19]HCC07600.1 hydrogenase [Clostridiales bacterium]